MAHPLLRYVLPSLILGAALGHFVPTFVATQLAASKPTLKISPRERFLSNNSDKEVDYEKLARVCLTAASRGEFRTSARASSIAEPNSPEVSESKKGLDHVMSVSLEEGVWSRAAAFRARTLLRHLPATDVANFEALLRTTLERGDMQVQPGAWVPKLVD